MHTLWVGGWVGCPLFLTPMLQHTNCVAVEDQGYPYRFVATMFYVRQIRSMHDIISFLIIVSVITLCHLVVYVDKLLAG